MPRTVLEKLRRASEQLPGRRKSSVAGSSMSEHRDSSINNQQASFLGLPAEIRNQIYERLALATTLSLTPPKSRKQGVLPVGLLLCCRQIHKEYRPLLLSLATIQIYVNDYNFGNVIRVLEKLQERDLALLLDNRLYIVLRLAHVPSRDDRQSLRAWHNYRSSGSGPYFKKGTMEAHKLAFKYDLYFHPQMRPPRPASRYADGFEMRLDLLRSHQRMVRDLIGISNTSENNGELRRLWDDLGEYEDLLRNAASRQD